VLKYHWIFNAQQTENLVFPDSEPVAAAPFNPIYAAEQCIIKTGAKINHGGDAAFYAPSVDRIQLPNKSAFDSEANYYATAFHELIHWTGAGYPAGS
jgi:antirestriction protein ArdC